MMTIETATGKKIDLARPEPEQIDACDIAHSLSMIQYRPSKAWKRLSLSEFSTLIHSRAKVSGAPREQRLAALFSQAYKAYWGFGDVDEEMRGSLCLEASILDALEERLGRAIGERFGFDWSLTGSLAVRNAIRSASQIADEVSFSAPSYQPESAVRLAGSNNQLSIDQARNSFLYVAQQEGVETGVHIENRASGRFSGFVGATMAPTTNWARTVP